jgi:integrase/recombinase XerD
MATTRALEKQEIHKLFSGVSGKYATRNRTMLICGISMALRATELISLNVGDVLDRNGTVKTYVDIRPETAKFERGRTVRIGEKVKRVLEEYIEYKREMGERVRKNVPLFVSQKGGVMTRQQLFRVMQEIFRQADINQSPHSLRKTGGTLYYLESGYDVIATQQFLGHTDPSTTRKYIGLTSEELALYSERLADVLFNAIEGNFEKCNTIQQMLHFSDADLLIELQQRGYDIGSLLKQKRKQELQNAEIISIDVGRDLGER